MIDSANSIELALPLKPEFVGIARLTASGVANRAGFDIETIEDIKVAVAEVCNRIVGNGTQTHSSYRIVFEILSDRLIIAFHSQAGGLEGIFRGEDDELGLSIINAFMDRVDFPQNDNHILSMTKLLKGNSVDGE